MFWYQLFRRQLDAASVFPVSEKKNLQIPLKWLLRYFLFRFVASYENHKYSPDVCVKPHDKLNTYPMHDLIRRVSGTECVFCSLQKMLFWVTVEHYKIKHTSGKLRDVAGGIRDLM